MELEVGKWNKAWDRSKKEFRRKAAGVKLNDKFTKVFENQDNFAIEIKKADRMIIRYSMARRSDKAKFLKPFTKLVKAVERIHKKFFLELYGTYKKDAERSKIEAMMRPLIKLANTCLSQAKGQIKRIEDENDDSGGMDPKLEKNIADVKKSMPGQLSKALAWVDKRSKDMDVDTYHKEFEKTVAMISKPVEGILMQLKKDKKKAEGKKLKVELDRFNNWCKGYKLPKKDAGRDIPKYLKDFNRKARRVMLAVNKIS